MNWIYKNHNKENVKIELFDKEFIGSISLTLLENVDQINPEIYNLIPDICPFNFSNTMYGYDLNVLEEYQNKGYGTKIIRECEKYLKKNNIKYFFLYRNNNNKRLDKFYKSFGFEDILITNDYILFYKTIY